MWMTFGRNSLRLSCVGAVHAPAPKPAHESIVASASPHLRASRPPLAWRPVPAPPGQGREPGAQKFTVPKQRRRPARCVRDRSPQGLPLMRRQKLTWSEARSCGSPDCSGGLGGRSNVVTLRSHSLTIHKLVRGLSL